MRIVRFDEFIRLPSGTIFAPYEPCILKECLSIKTDHGREFEKYGWLFNGVMPLEPWNLDCLYDADSVKATFEEYDGCNNDYSDYKQFLIFDDFDIELLIKVLQWAKAGCPDDKYDAFDET